jgi:hypothetical protein
MQLRGYTGTGMMRPASPSSADIDRMTVSTSLTYTIAVASAGTADLCPAARECSVVCFTMLYASSQPACADFRLPRVASINMSGHKYGLVRFFVLSCCSEWFAMHCAIAQRARVKVCACHAQYQHRPRALRGHSSPGQQLLCCNSRPPG